MTVSVKRTTGGGMGVVLTLVLGLSLVLPLAYSAGARAAEVEDKPRQGAAPHGPSDAKRPYAKRPGEAPRAQRLSPEERRQLRRDIKDAGREIYPARR